jgi:uncharacterized protein with von Willebrand factor type A (vWA) domain
MTRDPARYYVDTAVGQGVIDGGAFVSNVLVFARLLRTLGLDVDSGQTVTFLRALLLLGFERRADVRAAGSAILIRRREDQPIYQAAFDLFWRRQSTLGDLSGRLPRIRQTDTRLSPGTSPGPKDQSADQSPISGVRAEASSDRESLRNADFASLTPDECRDAQKMIEALRPRLPFRKTRRSRLDSSGLRPAGRNMLRRALGTGGEPIRWRWLRRQTRPRPLVLICDISGSMEHYSRFMLRFAHALQRSGAPVEVFVFGTRLTRITRQLRVRSPDAALRRVAERVVDWSGGTRIGESLRQLNHRWVRRTVRSGAIVLLVSDGWERGDPNALAREMAILRRSCHRLLWIDPLASKPGFEPATIGLRTALPYVDALIPAGSVASLAELGHRLGTL